MINIFRRHGRMISYLLVTDWMILVGTFGLALHYRHYNPGLNIISRHHIIPEAFFVFFYAIAVIGVFSALQLYKRKTILNHIAHFFRIGQGVTICILGYFLIHVLTKSTFFVPSRRVILNWAILQFGVLVIHRLAFFPLLLRTLSRTNLQRRIIIIGAQETGIKFAERCLNKKEFSTLKPIGFLCDHREKGEIIFRHLRCLGIPEDLPELVELHKLEGAVITSEDLSYGRLMSMIEQCIRCFGWVDIHTEKSSALQKNLDVDTYFDIPFVRMREIPQGPVIHTYKRITDVIGATIGIILLSPVMILTAIAIKLTSPGPVLYIRERVGYKGKLFPFYKFRSMTVGADQDQSRNEEIRKHIQNENNTPLRKVVNEAYVTPVGKFIRKWAIDELPQLFNVFKGDMSLVGPRPVPLNEYDMEDEWHRKRFEIKPGCTGLWKIYAVKQGNSFNESVLYDIYYARNMSLLLDLYIISSTILIILKGKADG